MVDIATLKELRRLTNAGLSDCRRALEDSDGDLFAAAVSMLSESDVQKLSQSMMVREGAGQSIKDPVTDSERELINALGAHFVRERTRPVNVGFLFEATSLFHSDTQFRHSLLSQPASMLQTLWAAMAVDSSKNSMPGATTVKTPQVVSTVITMPPPQSEWECDFVVLMHPQRRFVFFSSRPRVLAVYKRTKLPGRGVANIHEMAGTGDNVRLINEWVHEDVIFTPNGLSEIAFDNRLRKVN